MAPIRWLLPGLLSALLLTPGVSRACIWDSDTPASEAKGLPDVVQVITGRFERNPPLYYRLRLGRAAAAIQADPERLEAYDDAAAACDRLGRDDEAIRWMERKRPQLARSPLPAATLREHRYRYLANIGTFWAHRWLRAGADRRHLGPLRTARDFIREAIRLNPKAHFGRERYQLLAIEWILSPPGADGEDEGLPNFLGIASFSRDTRDRGYLRAHGYADAVQGLSGLIVLGNAWESVDSFHALSLALAHEGRSSLAYFARLRCRELIDAGRTSLIPGAPTGEALKARIGPRGSNVRGHSALNAEFRRLRAEAEAWHAHRTAFMEARLRTGRHPDTDPGFWAGYSDPGPPKLSGRLWDEVWV